VLVFLAVHIASSVIDAFAPIPWIAAVVPYASSYRPFWLGLGALAFDLLIALVVTSLLRQRIGLRTWRAVHWLAYACWPIAFVHGLGTGSDGRVGWVQALDLVCLAAVVGAVVWRLAVGWERDPGRRAAGAVAGALVVLVVLGWSATGPTQPGWSRKAGTPASVLDKVSGGSAAGTGSDGATDPGTAAGALTPPFTADYAATATTTGTSTETVTVDGTLSNGADGHLKVAITGTPVTGGGVRMTSGTVTVGPPDAPTAYTGKVSALSGNQIDAVVTSAAGDSLSLTIAVTIDGSTASGTVSAEKASR
jgi:sulfoxide reductase heme-binding subunit YedZ